MSSNRVRYLLLGIPLPRIQCSFYEQTTSIIIKYNRIFILVVSVVETNPISKPILFQNSVLMISFINIDLKSLELNP